jgi:hypothetical protein
MGRMASSEPNGTGDLKVCGLGTAFSGSGNELAKREENEKITGGTAP